MCNSMVERLNSTVKQVLHKLSEKLKYKWKDSLNKLMYAYNCTKHSVTGYSPYFLLFGRNPKLPIDIILSEHQELTNEQPNYHNFIQIWKVQMKEAFKIAEENTKKRRSSDKRQRDLKATLEPLEVGGRILVKNITERGGPGKIRSFWEQKIYRIKEEKDKDGLVYALVEEGNPKSRVRGLHRNHLLSCEQFPAFTEGESYRK